MWSGATLIGAAIGATLLTACSSGAGGAPPPGASAPSAGGGGDAHNPNTVTAPKAVLDGKELRGSTPVTCTWNSDHDRADVEEKATPLGPLRNDQSNLTPSWEVTFSAKPNEPVTVGTVSFLTPEMNWSGSYVLPLGPYDDAPHLFAMPKTDVSGTRAGSHFTFTGRVMATGRDFGNVPPPTPTRYATFMIEVDCP